MVKNMKKSLLIAIFIMPIFFLVSSSISVGETALDNPNLDCSSGICYPINTNLPDSDMKTIVTNFLNWILGIFGILAVIAFIISGIQYIISTGNERMMDTAKRSMVYSIIGVVVALAGLIIIFAIDKALRGTSSF